MNVYKYALGRPKKSRLRCLYISHIFLTRVYFSSVPRLPGWSFQQRIYGGVLPPPHCPDISGPAVFPIDMSRKDSALPPVEPVFGQIKNSGFRGFSLRGDEKVKGEFSLVCTVHNFRKIVKAILRGKVCLELGQLAPMVA